MPPTPVLQESTVSSICLYIHKNEIMIVFQTTSKVFNKTGYCKSRVETLHKRLFDMCSIKVGSIKILGWKNITSRKKVVPGWFINQWSTLQIIIIPRVKDTTQFHDSNLPLTIHKAAISCNLLVV